MESIVYIIVYLNKQSTSAWTTLFVGGCWLIEAKTLEPNFKRTTKTPT